jgi:hypothetical protein
MQKFRKANASIIRLEIKGEAESFMGFLPTGVCVIGLLSLLLLGRSLYQLRPNKNEILQLTGRIRLGSVIYGLLAGPPLAVAGLALIFAFILQDQLFLRIAHALLVLGLWMVLTLTFLIMIIMTRLGQRPSLTTLAAAVLSVPLVAYLTPLERFAGVFPSGYLYVPMATGLIIVATCYIFVLTARKELL